MNERRRMRREESDDVAEFMANLSEEDRELFGDQTAEDIVASAIENQIRAAEIADQQIGETPVDPIEEL